MLLRAVLIWERYGRVSVGVWLKEGEATTDDDCFIVEQVDVACPSLGWQKLSTRAGDRKKQLKQRGYPSYMKLSPPRASLPTITTTPKHHHSHHPKETKTHHPRGHYGRKTRETPTDPVDPNSRRLTIHLPIIHPEPTK